MGCGAFPLFPALDPTLYTDETPDYQTHDVGYFREPYRRLEDGHYVGYDGFVVPRSFAEYYEQFPRYVEAIVHRSMPRACEADREDRVNDVHLYLMELSEESRYREQGCVDRIQTFDPDKAHGANRGRFLNFVKLMVRKRLNTLADKRMRQPVERIDNYSYQPDKNSSLPSVDDEFIHRHRAIKPGEEFSPEDQILMGEFEQYLALHSPELVPVYRTIRRVETLLEAQQAMGMTMQEFTRARHRITKVAQCFHDSEIPPKQRKLYKLRREEIETVAVLSAIEAEEMVKAEEVAVAAPVEEAWPPILYYEVEFAAYTGWEALGKPVGRDLEIWLAAERHVRRQHRFLALFSRIFAVRLELARMRDPPPLAYARAYARIPEGAYT